MVLKDTTLMIFYTHVNLEIFLKQLCWKYESAMITLRTFCIRDLKFIFGYPKFGCELCVTT